jgi:hypothetical protein
MTGMPYVKLAAHTTVINIDWRLVPTNGESGDGMNRVNLRSIDDFASDAPIELRWL